MLLLYSADDAGPTPGSPEHAAEMQEWFAYTEALGKAGALVSGEPLQSRETATTVRVRDGETITTDGSPRATPARLRHRSSEATCATKRSGWPSCWPSWFPTIPRWPDCWPCC